MKSVKIESLSIGTPFLNINFKINDDVEKEIVDEVLIRSEDKRFLTSWQCCASCTENAIESVIEYRKFLLDQKVKISKVKNSQFLKIISYLLDEVKKFLSISEKLDIHKDQKFLSQQLEILRCNTLNALQKYCFDTRIEYPKELSRMLEIQKNNL